MTVGTTNTYGGGVDQTAVIGHAPEHRDWRPGKGAWFPLIHRTARIEAFVSVDAGMFRATKIGYATWLMKHVHVGHDALIGAECEIAPGAVIGGEVVLGERVRVGINACIRPRVKVGNGARIGAGAVVVCDVPGGEVWVGNPAKRMSRSTPGYDGQPLARLQERDGTAGRRLDPCYDGAQLREFEGEWPGRS